MQVGWLKKDAMSLDCCGCLYVEGVTIEMFQLRCVKFYLSYIVDTRNSMVKIVQKVKGQSSGISSFD